MHTDTPASTALLDTDDSAKRLTPPSGNGPSPRTLERWRSTGKGPRFVVVGRRRLHRQADVETWLDGQSRSFTRESA